MSSCSFYFALAFVVLSACGGLVDTNAHEATPERTPSSGGSSPPDPGAASRPDDSPVCTTPPAGVETIADLAIAPGDLGTTTGRIAVDERYVFVDTNRGLFRVPKCGGPAARIAENSPGQYMASGLVQDTHFVYLAATAPVRGGFVRRIAKDGSSVAELASTSSELFGLALARSPNDGVMRLYWVEKNAGGGTLRAQPVDAAAATETVATIPIAYSFGPFVADASGVTFFALGASNDGTFYRHPWSGITTAGTGAAPYAIEGDVATSTVYFTFGHTGANGIARLSTTGRLAESKAPCGLAKHGETLFWSDMSEGTVSRCILDGDACAGAFVIASAEDDPRQLTIDDVAVYWAIYRGVLRRAPL